MVTPKLLFDRKLAEDVNTSQYTVPPLTRTVIDKFTATNISASLVYLSVNLVKSGNTAGNINLVMKTRPIGIGETYTCPELVGQIMEAGSFLSTLASAAASIVLSVSGREIS